LIDLSDLLESLQVMNDAYVVTHFKVSLLMAYYSTEAMPCIPPNLLLPVTPDVKYPTLYMTLIGNMLAIWILLSEGFLIKTLYQYLLKWHGYCVRQSAYSQ
jgi:hypothetical protein